jgi:hypothetical protein
MRERRPSAEYRYADSGGQMIGSGSLSSIAAAAVDLLRGCYLNISLSYGCSIKSIGNDKKYTAWTE